MSLGQELKLTGRLDVRPAASPANAGCGVFDLVTVREVGEAKVTLKMQPYLPTFNADKGLIMPTDNVPRLDVEINSGDLYCYFDDVNKGSNLSAPRITLKKSVELADKTYKLDLTYARKGNTSVLPKLEPLPSDILKIGVDLPKMGDVNAKLEYGTLTKVASVTMKTAVKDAKLALKTDVNTNNQNVAWKANVNYPLPEGVGLGLELKDTMKGLLTLTKDRFVLDVPLDTKSGPNVKGITAKVKFDKRLDI